MKESLHVAGKLVIKGDLEVNRNETIAAGATLEVNGKRAIKGSFNQAEYRY